MIINGIDLDIRAFNVSFADKYEKAVKELQQFKPDASSYSAALRSNCAAIRTFIDNMFGAGISVMLCAEDDLEKLGGISVQITGEIARQQAALPNTVKGMFSPERIDR